MTKNDTNYYIKKKKKQIYTQFYCLILENKSSI